MEGLTSVGFGELQTQDLGVMSLDIHHLLHSVQVVNPAAGGKEFCHRESIKARATCDQLRPCPHPYLKTPTRSPEARWQPSGLTLRVLMPTRFWSASGGHALSVLAPATRAASSLSKRPVKLSST